MMERIAVLGGGTMGSGIACLFASHGCEVTLYEPEEIALAAAGARIDALSAAEARLDAPSADGNELNRTNTAVKNPDRIEADRGRMKPTVHLLGDLEKAVENADLIIEAVPENLTIKREVYAQLAPFLKREAIVASNTSTFALETLAEGQSFRERMIITHFFNPAHLIPLVEIVGHADTQPETLDSVARLLRRCEKHPVVLRKDIPGFIANRLQAALLREASYLLEQGVADAEQIDAAVREGLGLRWAFYGPFEVADLGGLDIWSKVSGHLFPLLSVTAETPELLRKKTANGELGWKSGKGFYTYEQDNRTPDRMQGNLRRLLRLKKAGQSQD